MSEFAEMAGIAAVFSSVLFSWYKMSTANAVILETLKTLVADTKNAQLFRAEVKHEMISFKREDQRQYDLCVHKSDILAEASSDHRMFKESIDDLKETSHKTNEILVKLEIAINRLTDKIDNLK